MKTLPCFFSFWIALMLLSPNHVKADEGMWLFNDLPTTHLKEQYGFEPSAQWADHLMKSCVRFNVGGSASFVSSNGLVLTNHHVGSDTLYKLSTKENNYAQDGFLAPTQGEELKAPDLELNQLLKITDVTDKVNEVIVPDMAAADAATARRARIGEIESAATKESGLRSDVVTLYGGGKYHLYQYKKYTDVRLVWAPESAIAFFGGDADNFEYPRYNLDACIFRVYENDKPAVIEHYLKWSANGPAENELVFVAGNPGSTSRIYTMDALRYQRDVRLPFVMDFIRRREILLQQFGLEGPDETRIAKDQLFGFQNSRKALMGELQGLQDPALMAEKQSAEDELRKAIATDQKMAGYAVRVGGHRSGAKTQSSAAGQGGCAANQPVFDRTETSPDGCRRSKRIKPTAGRVSGLRTGVVGAAIVFDRTGLQRSRTAFVG